MVLTVFLAFSFWPLFWPNTMHMLLFILIIYLTTFLIYKFLPNYQRTGLKEFSSQNLTFSLWIGYCCDFEGNALQYKLNGLTTLLIFIGIMMYLDYCRDDRNTGKILDSFVVLFRLNGAFASVMGLVLSLVIVFEAKNRQTSYRWKVYQMPYCRHDLYQSSQWQNYNCKGTLATACP